MIDKLCRGCGHLRNVRHAACIPCWYGSDTNCRSIRRASWVASGIQYRRATSLARSFPVDVLGGLASPISDAQTCKDEASSPSSTTTRAAVTLRPYQEDAVAKCLEALRSGKTRIGVSSPTGSGKTRMFMDLIPRIPSKDAEGEDGKGRTFILVSSVELANQAEAAVKRLLGDSWTVEVEQSKRKASGAADVTIATYQTLLNVERLQKFNPAKLKLVIVDEAHHAAADSYLRVLHYFNDEVRLHSALSPITTPDHGHKVPIVGFSATFSRPDQLALSSVFEDIVFHREITSMIQDGWLSPAISTTVKADLHLDSVKRSSTGDYSSASLALTMDTLQTNELIVRTYLLRASQRRSTLIFCVDLTHVANLTQAFRDAGIDARSVSSLSQPQARKQTIEAFGNGEFPVLLNCEVLTEGADIPAIDCIVLARPTRSKNLLAQMIGRGLRLSPETGKENCHIIDVVDSMSDGLLVTPTLLGIEHEELGQSFKERGEVTAKQAQDEDSEIGENNDADYRVTYIDEMDPFGINGSGENRSRLLNRLTRNAWVVCGHDKYVLDLMQTGWISVKPNTDSDNPGKFVITSTRQIPRELAAGKYYPVTKTEGYADSLERAIQAGDGIATRVLGFDTAQILARRHPWRSRPASEKAIAYLVKLAKIKHKEGENAQAGDETSLTLRANGREVPIKSLTAGEVASYLAGIKHGAKGFRSKQQAREARRQAKIDAKRIKVEEQAQSDLPLPLSS